MKYFLKISLIGFLFVLLSHCASTDPLCDRACSAWQSCVQVDGNYINYSYETCFSSCKSDGDWDEPYVSCVESQYYCESIGPQCG